MLADLVKDVFSQGGFACPRKSADYDALEWTKTILEVLLTVLERGDYGKFYALNLSREELYFYQFFVGCLLLFQSIFVLLLLELQLYLCAFFYDKRFLFQTLIFLSFPIDLYLFLTNCLCIL